MRCCVDDGAWSLMATATHIYNNSTSTSSSNNNIYLTVMLIFHDFSRFYAWQKLWIICAKLLCVVVRTARRRTHIETCVCSVLCVYWDLSGFHLLFIFFHFIWLSLFFSTLLAWREWILRESEEKAMQNLKKKWIRERKSDSESSIYAQDYIFNFINI